MHRIVKSGIVLIALLGGVVASPSAAHAAVITPPVTVTISPADITVIEGQDAAFTAAAKDAVDVDVPVAMWQMSEGAGWTAVPGSAGNATLALASVSHSQNGFSYRAAFDDGNGGVLHSAPAVLTVQQPPVVTTDPVDQLVVPGGAFTLGAAASGDPHPTAQWQTSTAQGGPWSDVAGATSTTFTGTAPGTASSTTWYRAVFTNAAGTAATAAAAVKTRAGVPNAVTSIAASNPAPRTLRATWPASSGGGAATSYLVSATVSGVAVTQATTTGLTWTFTLDPNTYRVTVIARNADGDSPQTTSNAVAVMALQRNSAMSSSVIRPTKDGYQDTVQLRASSNFTTSGSIRLLTSSRQVVRSWSLAAGKSWSVIVNGKDERGRNLRLGHYTVEWQLGGSVYASRSLQIASSKARALTVGWNARTFYPRKDGFGDSATLTVRTNVPAKITVKVTAKGSARAVKSKTWKKRRTAALVWNGRGGGGVVSPGTYRTTVTVKGRVGKAKSYSRLIRVSGKQIQGRAYTGYIDATDAYVRTLSGSFTGFSDGSIWLWSTGSTYDILDFGANLPASHGGRYGQIRISACAESDSSALAAAGVGFYDRFGSVREAFSLSRQAGCTSAVFPAAYVNGRAMRWYAGNVSDYFSYQEIGYFKFTTTIYELR